MWPAIEIAWQTTDTEVSGGASAFVHSDIVISSEPPSFLARDFSRHRLPYDLG